MAVRDTRRTFAKLQIVGLRGGSRIGKTGWRRTRSIINVKQWADRRAVIEIGARAAAIAYDE
jgi:hypothetical protein